MVNNHRCSSGRWKIEIIFFLLVGCSSLPEDIALRCYAKNNNCYEAAKQTSIAMKACGYEFVMVCQGYVKPDTKRHTWVEYCDGKDRIIVDPVASTGPVIIDRNTLPEGMYRIVFSVQKTQGR